MRGPGPGSARDYAEAPARPAREARDRRCRYDAQAGQAGVAGEIDRKRAADLDVDREDIASALAADGRRRRAKSSRFRDAHVNDDYDVQLRFVAGRIETIAACRSLGCTLPRSGRRAGASWTTWSRSRRRISASRIDRLDRQRQVSVRGRRAGVCTRGSAGGAATSGGDEPAGGLFDHDLRPRTRAGTHLCEFLWAFLLSIIFMYMILASQFESRFTR